jgi:hypothetical protein
MTSAMPQRNCSHKKANVDEAKGSKRICLPIDRAKYEPLVGDKVAFRQVLDQYIAQYPEIFPSAIDQGYKLHGLMPTSKKMPDVYLRRIHLKAKDETGQAQVFTLAPCFVLPYMTGYVDEVEKALFLHEKFGVAFWGLTYVFGRNDMYWYRLTQHLGRNSIVGTTLKDPDKLPEHLLADEKHTDLNGENAYLAITVAEDCVLGASLALAADEKELTEAYRRFKTEALQLKPDYQPQTVNTDGWFATRLAWKALFPAIVLISCFLHAFIKIRACCQRMKNDFVEIQAQVWDIYHAPDPLTFMKRVAAFKTWAILTLPKGTGLEAILKLGAKTPEFIKAYAYPAAYRTSNMIDRHMEPLARYLYSTKYFNGHRLSAERTVRAWALSHNFLPYCPRAKIGQTYKSPAHKLNGFTYRDNWLENLLVSASMGGYPS